MMKNNYVSRRTYINIFYINTNPLHYRYFKGDDYLILKDSTNLEIKNSRVEETDGKLLIVEIDKDGDPIETFTLEDLFENFVGRENVKIKIDAIDER